MSVLAGPALWLIEDRALAGREERALAELLSEVERTRLLSFADAGRRRQFLTTRAALRCLIAPLLAVDPDAVEIVLEPDGRPRLHDAHASRLQFSLAHTRGLLVVALHTRGSIGVDVEGNARARDITALAERFFHASESAYVSSAPSASEVQRRFTQCWTLKEAWFKAFGGSRSLTLSELSFTFDAAIGQVAPHGMTHTGARLWLAQPHTGYTVALAWQAEAPEADPQCGRFDVLTRAREPLDAAPQFTYPGQKF
jgi:4'-phosphopantetheinyl transferase